MEAWNSQVTKCTVEVWNWRGRGSDEGSNSRTVSESKARTVWNCRRLESKYGIEEEEEEAGSSGNRLIEGRTGTQHSNCLLSIVECRRLDWKTGETWPVPGAGWRWRFGEGRLEEARLEREERVMVMQQ